MLTIMLAIAALQGPSMPASAMPPLRYRLTVRTTSDQDLTAAGQGKMSGGLTANLLISVTATDSATGQIVKVTIDSAGLDPSGVIATQLQQRPNLAQEARGGWVRAFVVRGAMQGAPVMSDSSGNPVIGVAMQAIGVLFPAVKRGVKVGDAWADTTHINNVGGSRKQTGDVIANWKVTALEGDALVIDGTSATHTRAEDGSGQSMVVSGSSREHIVVPPHGPARRATIETSNDMTMTAPQQQGTITIPGKTSGTLTLTPVS